MKRMQTTLGLMRRAGVIAIGTSSVLDCIRSKQAKLVLTASDASAETLKQIADKASFYNTPYESIALTKDEIGAAIGKANTAAVAVTSESFVRAYRASAERDKA